MANTGKVIQIIEENGMKLYWCSACMTHHRKSAFSTDKSRKNRDGLRAQCKWADKCHNAQKIREGEKKELTTIRQTVNELVKTKKIDRITGITEALAILDTNIPTVVAEMVRIATKGANEMTRVRAGEAVAKLALGTKTRLEHSGQVNVNHGVIVLPEKQIAEDDIIDVEVLESETEND